MQWDDIFRRACERVGVFYDGEVGHAEVKGKPFSIMVPAFALLPYVASRLVEEAQMGYSLDPCGNEWVLTIWAPGMARWEIELQGANHAKLIILAALVALGECTVEKARCCGQD